MSAGLLKAIRMQSPRGGDCAKNARVLDAGLAGERSEHPMVEREGRPNAALAAFPFHHSLFATLGGRSPSRHRVAMGEVKKPPF